MLLTAASEMVVDELRTAICGISFPGLQPAALLVAAAVITGSMGVSLLKNRIGRPGPDVAFADLVAPGMSFPSGHAAMSAVVFLTLGALLAGTRSRTLEQMYILAVASLFTVLVGSSRIALGVHWATDVLAGWAIGAAWALIWVFVEHRIFATRCVASAGVGGRMIPTPR